MQYREIHFTIVPVFSTGEVAVFKVRIRILFWGYKVNLLAQASLKLHPDLSTSLLSYREIVYQRLKDTFEGRVQWYGETIKLDLEASGLIERTVPSRRNIA